LQVPASRFTLQWQVVSGPGMKHCPDGSPLQ
jgi:hypothetical protein